LRYEILFTSDYRYDAPVAGNHNRLRMRPTTAGTQRLEHFDVRIEPEALRNEYTDLFGNHVVELLVAEPHQELRIEVDALVATTEPLLPPKATWQDLKSESYRKAAGIYRYDPWPPQGQLDLSELIEATLGDTPRETADKIMGSIPERYEYRPGVTTVNSGLVDLLKLGAGVCQDFANLACALLRRHGIAARYVSGYFFTSPNGSGDSAEVDTHAWVEALLPVSGDAEHVWHGIDPTNAIVAGERHVKIGHGRVYRDVPPVDGAFTGKASSTVDAHVRMRRVES
jgi:transglutaminase-like putative cysteine protease